MLSALQAAKYLHRCAVTNGAFPQGEEGNCNVKEVSGHDSKMVSN